MLSLFPYLLSYQQIGPFIIRLILGLTVAYFGYKMVKSKDNVSGTISTLYGSIEMIIAILLIVGLFTQLAALIVAIFLVYKLILKIRSKAFLSDGVNYYILLLAMALSLLFTGAGSFSFDLPL